MSPFVIIVSLTGFAALAAGVIVWLWLSRSNLSRRVQRLNDEMLEASKDASVGHRLTVPNDPATAQIACHDVFRGLMTKYLRHRRMLQSATG